MQTNRFADFRLMIGILLFTLLCEGASISRASVILSSTPGDNYVVDSATASVGGTQSQSGTPVNFTGPGSFSSVPASAQFGAASASAAASVTIDTSNGALTVTQPALVTASASSPASSYSASASVYMQLKFSVTDTFETVQIPNNGFTWGGSEVLSLWDVTAGKSFWTNSFSFFPFPAVPTTPLTVGDTYEFSYSLGATTTSGFYAYGSPVGKPERP